MSKYSSDYSYYGNVFRKVSSGDDILVEDNAMLEYYDEEDKFVFLLDAMAYALSLSFDKEDDILVAEKTLYNKMLSYDRDTTNEGELYADPNSIRINMKYSDINVLIDNLSNSRKGKGKK